MLSNLTRSEENGHRLVTVELRVPAGKRVAVTGSQLVVDYGTAAAVRGPPTWAKQSDPSGKSYGPGTRTILRFVEPRERLMRLRLETMVFEVGLRAWLWKLKAWYQTKQLSAFKQWPPPRSFVWVQSELISSYQSQADGAVNASSPLHSN